MGKACCFGIPLGTSRMEQGKNCGLDLQMLKLFTGGAESEESAARGQVGGCGGAGAFCKQAVGNAAVYKARPANRRD